MRVRITPELLDLFRQVRLGTRPYGGERWQVGQVVTVDASAKLEPYAHIFAGETIPLALGAFSYNYSPTDLWLSMGRYCSVAVGVVLMGSDHPSDWASQSLFSYQPQQLSGMRDYMRDFSAKPYTLHTVPPKPVTVLAGHDVWIGGGAMIKRGVRIGTGAVIAARALVTRDVPPYAVVAGTPARILRYRFPEALIERLLASGWWRYGPDVLQPLDVRDPERFVDGAAALAESEHKPLQLKALTGAEIIAAGEVLS